MTWLAMSQPFGLITGSAAGLQRHCPAHEVQVFRRWRQSGSNLEFYYATPTFDP